MNKKGKQRWCDRNAMPGGICFEPLEPRLLLSGSWGAGIDMPSPDSSAHTEGGFEHEAAAYVQSAGLSDADPNAQQTGSIVDLLADAPVLNELPSYEAGADADEKGSIPNPSSLSAAAAAHELVFVDAGILNHAQLVDDLMAGLDTDRELEVIVLDADRDGVAQVSEALAMRDDIDAVHFVTHGGDGAVKLGATWLYSDNLETYAGDIMGWQDALVSDADLLFYGCELAANCDGRALLDTLGALTGADVAASDDPTGSALLGGDWDLEYASGAIDSEAVLSAEAQQTWSGVLATFTVDTNADTADANPGDGIARDASGNTSLRAAIEEANALAGADEISLYADTYTLTGGELEITEDLTINGADPQTTAVDGGAADRVFDLLGATVTMTDITIRNGSAADGAGVMVDGASNLTLSNVAVSDNQATGAGGGIFASGTLNLDRVTLEGNSADVGGGIYVNNSADVTLVNTTLSGNTAASNGGAIFTRHTVAIINSTIAHNNAAGAGGIHKAGSGNASLKNTILANNGTNSNGALISQGYNIDSGNTAGLTGPGDQIMTEPQLAALNYYGGNTKTHALLDGSPAIDAGISAGAPLIDQRGASRDLSPDVGAYEATPSSLWLSTTGNVTSSGAPGLNAWQNGEVIQLADPNLAFDPGTTNGTFSSAFNLEALAGTNIDVDALHYVTRNITLGTTHTVILQSGDVLFSTNGPETIQSLPVARDDIMRFRPDTPGDHSSGTFAYVLRGPLAGVDLKAFTLIEQSTPFGDTTLNAGDFLFSQEVGNGNDVYVFRTAEAGNGTTAGTVELAIAGNDIGITAAIDGLELLETNTTLGDETLAAGELLVSVDVSDNGIGTSGITAEQQDIFHLQIVKTNLVTGTAVADAALLMDGSALNLNPSEGDEDIDALTVVSSGNPTATPSSHLTVTTADDVADGDTSSVAALIDNPGADGQISLREAIIAANATDGINTVNFDIAGSGPHTINLSAALPNITGTLVIDGTTEPDYGSAPVVRIDGSALMNEDALRLEHGSTGSTICGLSVTEFSGGDAIEIRSDYNTIIGNYLGLATNGTTVAGNDVGVKLRDGAAFNTIGGTDAADRNLISGNIYAGAAIREFGTDDNQIIGNWIGLDQNGDVVSVGDHGVVMWDGPHNNWVGGINPGEGNRIAGHNNGVVVDDLGVAALDNAILGNEIFAVNEMAIDLDNELITANDVGDSDSGPNDLLNHPVLTLLNQNGADLEINFDLDVPTGTYRIEFFENPAGIGGIGLGEGQVFLGAVTVVSSGTGTQNFSETLTGVTATAIGSVTATATEDLGGGSYGSTSEFCGPGPVNSEQVLAVNTGTTVPEGSTGNVITTAMLETTDIDNSTTELVYTVTAVPAYGTLYIDTTALGVNDTFTQDDLDNNRISYDHDGSENFTDSFGFDVDDGAGAVTSDTFDITVNPVNDAATVSSDSQTLTETGAPLATSGTLTSTDADNPDDTFTADTIVGAIGTFDIDGSGNWSFTANSAFDNLNVGDNVNETFNVTSVDGTASTVFIQIDGTNDAATVSSDSQTLTETDAPLATSGTLTSTDVDNPDDTFTADTIVGTIGTFSIDAAGAWTFTANSAFDHLNVGDNVNETFNVASVDGTASTVTITINGTNDAATVSSDSQTLTETGAPLATSGTLTSTDVDNPDDTFTADTIVGTIGTFDIDGAGAWTFTANSAFDHLNVGDNVNETFNVASVDGTASTVFIQIDGTNDAATVSSDSQTLTETDAPLATSGTLTSTDVDNPDDTFTADTIVGTIGTFTIDGAGNWTFTANSAFDNLNIGDNVNETFNVTSADGTASTVTIQIDGTNDAATVSSASQTLTETDAALSTSGTLTSTDVDNPDDAFTPDIIVGAIGTFGIDGAGAWSFTANSAFDSLNVGDNVNETFNVTSADGTASTVTIQIDGTNDAATVSSASQTLTEADVALTTSGTLTSSDVDNLDDAFTASTIVGTIGTFTIDAAGAWSFTANSAFDNLNVGDNVNETFNVTSVDGTASTVFIQIDGTNDAATVSSDSQTLIETDAPLATSGTLTSTDVDNPDDTFSADTIVGAIGTFDIDGSGNWSFTANSAFDSLNVGDNVNETFNVTSADGTASTVTIQIDGSNDAPTTALVTLTAIAEDSGARTITQAELLSNASDIEGDSLTATGLTISAGAGTLMDNGDGTWDYTPAADDDTAVSFSYTISDGSASVVGSASLDITPVNEPPTAVANSFTVPEGASANLNLAGNDSDVDDGLDLNSITIVSGPGHGTIDRINADGSIDYTHDGTENFFDSFTYTIDDNSGVTSNTVTVDLTITPVNDPPGVTLNNTIAAIAPDADTSAAIKVADIVINDDAQGTNNLALTGSDAAMFQIVGGNALFLRAGAVLNATANPTLDVAVTVDDTTVGGTPDASGALSIAVSVPSSPETPTVTIPVDTGETTDPTPDPLEEDPEAPVDPEEPLEEDVVETLTPPAESATGEGPSNRVPARMRSDIRGDANRTFASFRMAALNFKDIVARLSGVTPAEQTPDAVDPGSQRAERQVRVHNLMSARVYLNMLQTLNEVKQEMVGDIAFNQTVLGSAIIMSTGLSVGYVVWLVRGGMLLSSLLSSLPAWQILDPLPILARRKDGEDSDDEESLESILDRKPNPPDPQTDPEDGSEDAKRRSD